MAGILTRTRQLAVAQETTEGVFEAVRVGIGAGSADAGSTKVPTTSAAAFAAGDTVVIDPGGANEATHTVESIVTQIPEHLVIVPSATTTVDQDSASGQDVLNVTATTGFIVGRSVIINRGGAREEIKVIASVQAGVSLTMTVNLSFTHTQVQADAVDQGLLNTHAPGTIVTANHLANTLAALVIHDFKWNPEVSPFKRKPYKSSLSQLVPISGIRRATMTFKMEIKGTADIASVLPEADLILKASGMARTDALSAGSSTVDADSAAGQAVLNVAATTNFTVGMPITINAGGPREEVHTIKSIDAGVSLTLFADLAFAHTAGQADTVTMAVGRTYKPISQVGAVVIPSLSLEVRDGTVSYRMKGARCNVKAMANNGEIGFFEIEAKGGIYQVVDYATFFGGTGNAVVPPAFLGASARVHGVGAIIFKSAEADLGNAVEMRENANDPSGIHSFRITDRTPTGKMDPEMEAVAVNDFYGKFFNSLPGDFTWQVGSTANNRVRIYCPHVTYETLADEDRSGIATLGLSMGLAETVIDAEDELWIQFT